MQDERIALTLEESGVDIESDEGARVFQDEVERAIERERKRLWQRPPVEVERCGAIRI